MLNAIQTYSFNWKDKKNKSYGVIAQELEKVMPELVEKTLTAIRQFLICL